jgi:hypothetical protein
MPICDIDLFSYFKVKIIAFSVSLNEGALIIEGYLKKFFIKVLEEKFPSKMKSVTRFCPTFF